MSVTLSNQAKRMQVFILPHAQYCEMAGKCSCTTLRSGVRLSGALTIPVGGVVTELPDAILNVPSVAKAMAEAWIKAERFSAGRRTKAPESSTGGES